MLRAMNRLRVITGWLAIVVIALVFGSTIYAIYGSSSAELSAIQIIQIYSEGAFVVLAATGLAVAGYTLSRDQRSAPIMKPQSALLTDLESPTPSAPAATPELPEAEPPVPAHTNTGSPAPGLPVVTIPPSPRARARGEPGSMR